MVMSSDYSSLFNEIVLTLDSCLYAHTVKWYLKQCEQEDMIETTVFKSLSVKEVILNSLR